MGDDTWINLFPDAFESSMRFPYDSFNVEDLHTVDEGVIERLFPLLRDTSRPWDFLIGHFLGVDHVGHRVGPGHPIMKTKLEQMNDVFQEVVDLIDDETLLVLIGDHGMDSKGDHGGDGELETSAATWIYSKSIPLQLAPTESIPAILRPNSTFPEAPSSYRTIQQIDLVPTLSLLLGLPIPFNNLGTVIPELFARGRNLQSALHLNADQVKSYLDAYRASGSGKELDGVWEILSKAFKQTKSLKSGLSLEGNYHFARTALQACRAL